MKRRTLLAGLLAAPAVTYFDMGASWKKHGDLYVFDGIDRGVYPGVPHFASILKKHYNEERVASLTYKGDPFARFGPPLRLEMERTDRLTLQRYGR
jgi:hypothetical protein